MTQIFDIMSGRKRERGDGGDKESEEGEEGRGPEPNGFHGPEYRLQLY